MTETEDRLAGRRAKRSQPRPRRAVDSDLRVFAYPRQRCPFALHLTSPARAVAPVPLAREWLEQSALDQNPEVLREAQGDSPVT
jgi:hypothetical protein